MVVLIKLFFYATRAIILSPTVVNCVILEVYALGVCFFRNSVVMNFDHFQTRRPLPLLLSPSFSYDQIHPDKLIQYDLFLCLLKFSPRDNVHLTEMGYKVLTGKIV